MKNYANLFWGAFFLICSIGGLNNYFDDTDRNVQKAKIYDLEKLVKAGVKVTALRDSMYRETTIKIARIPVTSYSGTYQFMIGDVMYSNTYRESEKPTNPLIEIYYLPQDPSINSQSPEAELRVLKENQTSKFGLYLSLFFLFAGVGSIWGFIKNISEQKRQEAAELQLETERFNQMKEAEHEEKKRKAQAYLENNTTSTISMTGR